ncbi:hypothetical protein MRX96_019738 [Rhipicephalus microplus]
MFAFLTIREKLPNVDTEQPTPLKQDDKRFSTKEMNLHQSSGESMHGRQIPVGDKKQTAVHRERAPPNDHHCQVPTADQQKSTNAATLANKRVGWERMVSTRQAE